MKRQSESTDLLADTGKENLLFYGFSSEDTNALRLNSTNEDQERIPRDIVDRGLCFRHRFTGYGISSLG